jgi:hypothetical protein
MYKLLYFMALPFVGPLVVSLIAFMLDKERLVWSKDNKVDLDIGVLNIHDICKMEDADLKVLKRDITLLSFLMTLSMLCVAFIFYIFAGRAVLHLSFYMSPWYAIYIAVQVVVCIIYCVVIHKKSKKLRIKFG